MQQCDSPYVVKYYGSYFKNTDLWIVMEYCGAGSVSDIMRLVICPSSKLAPHPAPAPAPDFAPAFAPAPAPDFAPHLAPSLD